MEDLRRLRCVLHISQLRLAQIAGVTHRHVQMSEEGLRELSDDEQLRILRVLRRAALDLQSFLATTFGDQVKRRRHRRRQVREKT